MNIPLPHDPESSQLAEKWGEEHFYITSFWGLGLSRVSTGHKKKKQTRAEVPLERVTLPLCQVQDVFHLRPSV